MKQATGLLPVILDRSTLFGNLSGSIWSCVQTNGPGILRSECIAARPGNSHGVLSSHPLTTRYAQHHRKKLILDLARYGEGIESVVIGTLPEIPLLKKRNHQIGLVIQ